MSLNDPHLPCPRMTRLAERAARVRIAILLDASGDCPQVIWPDEPRAAEALRWLVANIRDSEQTIFRAVNLGSPDANGQPMIGVLPIRSEILRHFDEARATELIESLEDCLVTDVSDADRLITALGFTAEDLALTDDAETAADDLAEKLADAYECNVLMHGLSKMLNRPVPLDHQVREACMEIATSLGFAWASMIFLNDESLPRSMRGEVLGGGPDCPPAKQLRKLSSELLKSALMEYGRATAMPHRHATLGVSLLQPIMINDKPVATLLLAGRNEQRREIDSYDLTLIESVGGFLGPFIENAALDEERVRAFYGMLRALSAAVDAKDPYTRGHSERVAMLAAMIAEALGQPKEQVERIRVAGIVHDIGKIGVPEHILTKPDRLTDEEFAIIKTHPEVGYSILESVHELVDVMPAVLHHHERWDGKGYPHGLAGLKIPEIARILGVADAFDAMSSTRAYRQGMSTDRALEQIRLGSGTQFDPRIAEAFLQLDLSGYRLQLAEEDRRSRSKAA
jgi:putative nucleotidyltransferase with HDIG domain